MKIGGAWKRQSKNGKEFISISIEIPVIGKLNFVLFENDQKKAENHPDYDVIWSPDRKKESSVGVVGKAFDDDVPF